MAQLSLLLTVCHLHGMASRFRGFQMGKTQPFHNSCPACARQPGPPPPPRGGGDLELAVLGRAWVWIGLLLFYQGV